MSAVRILTVALTLVSILMVLSTAHVPSGCTCLVTRKNALVDNIHCMHVCRLVFFLLDINECAYTNGGCKYSCSNIGGGHTCNCSNGIDDCCIDGYMLSPDRSKCVSK